MLHDRKNRWSSVERFALYVDEDGSCMYRKTLFRKLKEYHGENVAQSLHLEKNTGDDVEYCVDRVAPAVTNECLD